MASSTLNPDTRGILAPAAMRRAVEFERFPPREELAGLVDWLWSVSFDLPPGAVHRQDVLPHPCLHVSVGNTAPPGADPPPGPYPLSPRVVGVSTGVVTRVLSGRGWNVAAKSTIGGFGAFTTRPARELTGAEWPMGRILDVDATRLARDMADADTARQRADLVEDELLRLLQAADPKRVAGAREVAAVANRVVEDRTIRRATDLAAIAGVTLRTLQRLFSHYVGMSPAGVIRRYRLLEAAELVRTGERVVWAQVADELGYADQAHLIRDFATTFGTTPEAYARAQRDG